MSILLPLCVFLIAVLLGGFFAGYETGFISATPIRIRYMAQQEKSSRAARLLSHIQKPDAMLTTLLIGTNTAMVVATTVFALQVAHLFSEDVTGPISDLVSTVILAPVLLVCCEILPKSVFRTHPNRLTLALLPVIEFFYAVLAPLVVPISWLSRLLLRTTGGVEHYISPLMASLEDVRALVDEGVDHGAIEPEEQEMIHSVIDLQTTQAKEIMVPRIHIRALPDTATRRELVALFDETGLTRIPIYEETIDNIIGVVNAYDLLLDEDPANDAIGRFVRAVMHVPDTLKVGDLLQALKDSQHHMAIVTDEYGGTDGLVTLEDILEEIFGEIQDEYDREESPIQKVGTNAYTVDALMPLDEVAESINVPMSDEEVETIGGWLMHVAGHIPAQGKVITHGRLRMTVLDGSASHVAKIRLEVLPEALKPKKAAPPTPPEEPTNP